ncbi:MAG TPA: ATP-binding protein [Solirubrobacteraceae bacterium]|nr:ATP-binding protein [Solirubrobacteraceae bacterium]
MQIALPARAENIAIVRHALGALEDAYALDAQTLSDIRLAVTEACTNVVVHAYPDGGEGPMEVLATMLGDELHVVVRDEGTGISPRPDSPGLGLGLPLIASLAESVQLGRDERQRTEVRMTFSLNNAPHHYDGAAARNGAGAAQAATATQPVGAATAQANPTDGRAADTGAAAGPATFGATESTGSQ